MNKLFKLQIIISVLLLIIVQPALCQQGGIKWINIIGGKGHENSPGFVNINKKNYFAFTFEDKIVVTGTNDTLQSTGGYDGIIVKYNNNGHLNDYWWLKSNGYISINSISKRHKKIVIAGCFQDTLKLKTKNNSNNVIIATSPVELSGYILELNNQGQVIRTIITDTTYTYSYYSKVFAKNNKIAASGIVLYDTVLHKNYNKLYYQKGNNIHKLILSDVNCQKVNDLAFFKKHILFCGAYMDTVVFNHDTLIPESNGDAYFSGISLKSDSSFTKKLRSSQQAEAVSLLKKDSTLWVAVNFYDTLFIQDTIKMVSKGARDIAILKYSSNFNLTGWFQIGGILNERVDKLTLKKKRIYLLTNVSSPLLSISNQDSLQFEINQDNVKGNAALFSLDSTGVVKLSWLIKQDWATKITHVVKITDEKTMISGVFDKKMTIDSNIYFSNGGQDAYFLKISDNCLNGYKAGNRVVRFCEGDSIYIPNVYEDKEGFLKIANDTSRGIYITEPCSIKLKIIESCGCTNTDSIVFQKTDFQKTGFINDFPFEKRVLHFFNDSIKIELNYIGDCTKDEDLFTADVKPNPFSNSSDLLVSTTMQGTITYQLYSMQGKPLTPQTEQKIFGNKAIFKLPVQTLPSGTYLLKVIFITEDFTKQETLLIIKL